MNSERVVQITAGWYRHGMAFRELVNYAGPNKERVEALAGDAKQIDAEVSALEKRLAVLKEAQARINGFLRAIS